MAAVAVGGRLVLGRCGVAEPPVRGGFEKGHEHEGMWNSKCDKQLLILFCRLSVVLHFTDLPRTSCGVHVETPYHSTQFINPAVLVSFNNTVFALVVACEYDHGGGKTRCYS